MINTEKIWMNGKLVGHDDANIHILSHVVHYGSSVFEGIRIYKTENGPAIFRLREHVKRLFDSAKIYRMEIPYTVEEIAREAESAYKAGASIIHLHVREDDGTPTQDKERFRKCMEAIREKCPDVIIQPSTGGAVGMSDLERLQPTELHPEMATLDCGTCNFGGDEVFVNTENTIKNFGKILIERGVKPEIEVFDKGMVDYAIRFQKQGFIQKPMHFDFVLGVQMSASARDLVFMVESIPEGSTWTVAGVGRHQFQMAALAIVMGGHVRVGFEDNVYIDKGVLAKSNGELVERVVRLAKELGREIATPDEARQILSLKK